MKTLTVGSALIDIFLTLEDSEKYNVSGSELSFTLGNKVPVDMKTRSLGGNGANVAVGLARLGITSQLFTYLGTDPLSEDIKKRLEEESVEVLTDGKERDASFSLVFELEKDRIIFSHHKAQDHDFEYSGLSPEFVYLTSIGKEWENAYEKVLQFCRDHTIPFAFSPGTSQLEKIDDVFLNAVSQCAVLLINKEEAQLIAESIHKRGGSIHDLLLSLKSLGPKVVSVTDGANGAYAIDQAHVAYKITAPSTTGDKTGAGDSYASGFVSAYIKGLHTADCMKWGTLNAVANLREIGATAGILRLEEMEKEARQNPIQASIVV